MLILSYRVDADLSRGLVTLDRTNIGNINALVFANISYYPRTCTSIFYVLVPCRISYRCCPKFRAGVLSTILGHVLVYSGPKFRTVVQDSGH